MQQWLSQHSDIAQVLYIILRSPLRTYSAEHGKIMAFSRIGLGRALANNFESFEESCRGAFPNVKRGNTILIAADFSGSHRGQLFDTYSFIIFDIDRNLSWRAGQREFRAEVLRSSRRMAFKSLNDKQRRDALVPFLDLADAIEGWLVTFAISKVGGSLFAADTEGADSTEELKLWKPHVAEQLMRVVHLSTFLLSGLSIENQNIFWITDEDAIAANTTQLTQVARLVGRVASQTMGHNFGHLRCGTTQSDDGTLWLEDIASICDLASGSIGEILTAMKGSHASLQAHVASPVPKNLSWKARAIMAWQAHERSRLKRMTCLLDLSTTSSKMKVGTVKWHRVPGLILTP